MTSLLRILNTESNCQIIDKLWLKFGTFLPKMGRFYFKKGRILNLKHAESKILPRFAYYFSIFYPIWGWIVGKLECFSNSGTQSNYSQICSFINIKFTHSMCKRVFIIIFHNFKTKTCSNPPVCQMIISSEFFRNSLTWFNPSDNG